MRVRALTPTGDWSFGKGANDYKRDQSAIAQNLQTRILSFLGDCFFDLNAGIDWFNLLGGKDQLQLNLAISTVMLNTEGVTGILQVLALVDESRNFTVQYQVQTIYSVLSGNFEFDLNGIS